MAKSEPGVIEFGNDVPVSSPSEESEELTPEEQAQKEAMSRGEDPTAVEAAEADQPGLEPEAAEEPEAPAEAASEQPAKPKREVRVPLSEVQKEREKRQTLEKKLAEMGEAQVRADERWRMLEAAQKQQQNPQAAQQQPEPEPDRELDPIGWQDWKIRRQDEWLTYLYQQQQQSQQVQQRNEYTNYIQSSEAQFATEHPEYFPTINKLQQHLDMMFQPAYPDPTQRKAVIAQWTQQTIQAAVQAGQNPAAMVYQVAKNAGLTEGEAQAAAAETEQVQRATAPRPSIQATQTAQRASRTLSNVAGVAPKMPPTNREVADMTEEAWEEYSEQIRAKGGNPLRVILNQR